MKNKILLWIALILAAGFTINSIMDEIGTVGVVVIIFLVVGILLIKPIVRLCRKGNKQAFPENAPYETAEEKGENGEIIVASILGRLAQEFNARVINDVIITLDNETSQVDHIFLHYSGIYVIETKNYSGGVYGSEKQKYWTQVLARGNEKHSMYNPIMQNEKHIKRISDLGNIKAWFHSLIVFVQGNIEHIDSNKVFSPVTLEYYIRKHINDKAMTDVELDIFYDKLMDHKNKPRVTLEEHVNHIKNPHEELNTIDYEDGTRIDY